MSVPNDQPASGGTSTCPWCSAAVQAEADRCPSCGAALGDGVDDEVPGVTQVDPNATSRLARQKPPGRVAMWLGAEPTTEDASLSGRIEPPSEEVRKEMLRLELAAIDAEIEVKATLAEAQRRLQPVDGGPETPAVDDAGAPVPTDGADGSTAADDLADVADATEAGSPTAEAATDPGDAPDRQPG
jgi:hypothetical protein